MSRALDICATMKARIEAVAAIDEVPVHVYRQQDIATEIAVAVDKQQLCIVLYPVRLRRDGDAPRPQDPYAMTALLEIFAQPVAQPASGDLATAADDVVERVAAALDGWRPTDGAASGHHFEEWTIRDLYLVPDDEYLVWRIEAAGNVHLPPS